MPLIRNIWRLINCCSCINTCYLQKYCYQLRWRSIVRHPSLNLTFFNIFFFYIHILNTKLNYKKKPFHIFTHFILFNIINNYRIIVCKIINLITLPPRQIKGLTLILTPYMIAPTLFKTFLVKSYHQ